MLYSLSVSNYILIGSLDTTFPEGLIIISGETGAGKSILLGALSLVLGAKADAAMVGPNGENCIVEAEFGITPAVRKILREADLPDEGDRLILRRTVALSGRSRSFANDEPVTLPVLQDLARELVDIHSQHQTLKLGDERFRMDALDLWAHTMDLREECSTVWSRVLEARRNLAALKEREAKAVAEQEYNSARWERLHQAKLTGGELEALEAEQNELAHAEQIKETLCGVEELLSPSSEESASPAQLLREASRLLEKAGAFIPSLNELAQRVTSARLEVEDIAAEVATVNSRTEASPERLQVVEERLSLLYGLLQKHGVQTVEELMAERDRLEGLVMDATSLGEECARVQKELEALETRHLELCASLGAKRAAAAAPFAQAVEKVLHRLELDHAVFQVQVADAPAGALGANSIQFLFSSTGKAATDIAKAASGGELSRIMLSLKSVMARLTQMPTLVFDEIDTGVSGSAADKMGSLVCEMGADMQVFAITHLPQVAAKGHAHYLVSKTNDITSIKCLDGEGRVLELARMLSGATVTPAAIANAQALLNA
ncbi:MAG: DNA repair protein RecN [Bacteroidales bacterium]|nr:DNA repair protein RecN [Bacteroidales bacterium]